LDKAQRWYALVQYIVVRILASKRIAFISHRANTKRRPAGERRLINRVELNRRSVQACGGWTRAV
jgi:hypothetical protein